MGLTPYDATRNRVRPKPAQILAIYALLRIVATLPKMPPSDFHGGNAGSNPAGDATHSVAKVAETSASFPMESVKTQPLAGQAESEVT